MGLVCRSSISRCRSGSRFAKQSISSSVPEFYNILNRANFANPPARLNNALGNGAGQLQPGQPFSLAAAGGAFGIANSTVTKDVGLGTNRQIQLSLRLNF